jgi:hypothetical protein
MPRFHLRKSALRAQRRLRPERGCSIFERTKYGHDGR